MNPLLVGFKRWLSRYRCLIEFCKDCGCQQPIVWTAPDELWAAVTGRPLEPDMGGVLCPTCFDRRAVAQGRLLYWTPREDGAA